MEIKDLLSLNTKEAVEAAFESERREYCELHDKYNTSSRSVSNIIEVIKYKADVWRIAFFETRKTYVLETQEVKALLKSLLHKIALKQEEIDRLTIATQAPDLEQIRKYNVELHSIITTLRDENEMLRNDGKFQYDEALKIRQSNIKLLDANAKLSADVIKQREDNQVLRENNYKLGETNRQMLAQSSAAERNVANAELRSRVKSLENDLKAKYEECQEYQKFSKNQSEQICELNKRLSDARSSHQHDVAQLKEDLITMRDNRDDYQKAWTAANEENIRLANKMSEFKDKLAKDEGEYKCNCAGCRSQKAN